MYGYEQKVKVTVPFAKTKLYQCVVKNRCGHTMSSLSFNSSSEYVFSTEPGNFTSAPSESCRPFAEDTNAINGLKIMLYSIVLISSLFGNFVIIVTVARKKRMRTTINYLIANMAASDLLISTFAVPIKLSEIVVGSRRWLIDGILGLISCKLGYFFQDISMAVSTFSLVLIAIDRHRGIVSPFRPAITTPKRCKVIIPLIWLLAMGLHAIYFYTARLESHHNNSQCIFNWEPKFHLQKAQEHYFIVILVLLVMLPFSIVTVLYCQIIWVLQKEKAAYRSFSYMLCKRHKENAKVIKNLCAVMFVFASCVLPLSIYGILYYFVWKWKMSSNMEKFGYAAHFILFSNDAITPVIYFVFNDRYRKGLKDILRGLYLCNKDVNGEIELNQIP